MEPALIDWYFVFRYMLLADYEAYIKAQERVSATYAVSIYIALHTWVTGYFENMVKMNVLR